MGDWEDDDVEDGQSDSGGNDNSDDLFDAPEEDEGVDFDDDRPDYGPSFRSGDDALSFYDDDYADADYDDSGEDPEEPDDPDSEPEDEPLWDSDE